MFLSSKAGLEQSSINPSYKIAVNGQRIFISNGSELQTERLGCNELRQSVDLGIKGDADIKDLVFNDSQNLLAIVRKRNILIADLSCLRIGDQDINQNLIILNSDTNNSNDEITSVLWHPASSTKSHLVVLHHTKVAIYDYAISSSPQFELRFQQLQGLDGHKVISMAFGSSNNFAGSTSLYLSTNQGSVFVITPFMYNGFSQRFTTEMISRYLDESDACFNYLNKTLPPSSIFIPFWAAVLSYDAYRSALQNLFRTLKMGGYDDKKEWTFKATELANPRLVGPLYQTHTQCKLLNVVPHEPTTTIACMHSSSNGKVMISYISQIRSLIYACELGLIQFEKPIAPAPKETNVSTPKYVQPRRGFGFKIVEDDDEVAKKAAMKDMEKYKLDLADYHALQSSLMTVSNNFNLLTNEKRTVFDDIPFSSLHDVFWDSLKSWLILNLRGKVYVSDVLTARKNGVLNPKYLRKSIKADAFGFLDDSHRSELTLLAYGPDLVKVIFAQKKIEKPVANSSYKSETRATRNGKNTTLPAEDLKTYLNGPLKPANLKPVDTDSSESLRDIFEASTTAVHKIKTMTLFILALQSTLAIQHGELKLQQQGLKEIPPATSFKVGKETEARVRKVLERQEKLSKRAEDLQSLITERFENSKMNLKLPLSKSEKAWFRELNSVTTEIGTDTEESLSLQLIVCKLTEKVSLLQTEESTLADKLSKDLETLRMDKTWQRLRFILKHEQKRLSDTKLNVENLLQQLEKLNLGTSV